MAIDWKAINTKLGIRCQTYATKVRNIMEQRIGEIVEMCEGLELQDGKPFAFADYPEVSQKVQATFRLMYSEIYQSIRNNITQEWYYSNADMDGLITGLFGKGAMEDKHFAKYFARNKEAMNLFFARKEQGMNLSQRVWAITGNTKQDMEVAIDLSLGQGVDAGDLSRKVRQYLQEPDMLFRRFRYRVQEPVLDEKGKPVLDKDGNPVMQGKVDKDGNPVYGRKWKRRHYDKATDSFYWADDNPNNYHFGRGVYRSSYKNAMRLARTETNMAYRAADCERWKTMEFVRGFRVVLSKNHPCDDICNELSAASENDTSGRGEYPKGFMFKGWHPHCYCYCVPLLCTEDELFQLTDQILRGEDTSGFAPAGVVEQPNEQFLSYVDNNKDKIAEQIADPNRGWSSLPYWLQDNYSQRTGKGNWVQDIKNEAGLDTWGKVLQKGEIDIDKFSKVQSVPLDEFKQASNFVEPADMPLLTGGKQGDMPFGSFAQLEDEAFMQSVLQQAQYGSNGLLGYTSEAQLAELEKIATQARFASKADGTFVTALGKSDLSAILSGDKAVFNGGRYVGANYSETLASALKNGVVGESEGAVAVLKLPKGSRYAQMLLDEQPTALLLPNTKFKVVSNEVKIIVQGGKATKVTHYTLELVEDGSAQVQKVAQGMQQAKADVRAYNKAVKVADNVRKAASKWTGAGVDTSYLESVVSSGTASEIQVATKELAKEINEAKKALKAAYGDLLDDPVAIYMQHGKPALDSLYNAVQGKLAQWQADWHYTQPDKWHWLKKKLDFEIKYVEDKKAHSTWQEAQAAFKKKLVEVENKIILQPLEADINAAVTFASKSKKLQGIQAELQALTKATVIDEPAIKAKLAEAQKEIQRLEKSRVKSNGAVGAFDFNAADLTQQRKDAALWASSPAEADKAIRSYFGSVWRTLTDEEKEALYYYTHTYCPINEPLRGFTYIGDAKKLAEAQAKVPHLKSAMDKARMPIDMWTQRGEYYNIFQHTFGIDLSYVSAMSVKDMQALATDKLVEVLTKSELKALAVEEKRIEKALQAELKKRKLAKGTPEYLEAIRSSTEYRKAVEGYMDSDHRTSLTARQWIGAVGKDGAPKSMGDSKGAGFSSKPIIYNIYMPKGTKCFYLEPFSAFGNGTCSAAWDGLTAQSSFGYEAEILLQLQTKLRITKMEFTGGTWYVDVEVVGHAL